MPEGTILANIPLIWGPQALKQTLPLLHSVKASCDTLNWYYPTTTLFMNQTFFHQIRGVAMGSTFASNYANLYVGPFEEELIY